VGDNTKGVIIVKGSPTSGKDTVVRLLKNSLRIDSTTSMQRVNDEVEAQFGYGADERHPAVREYKAALKRMLVYVNDWPTKDAIEFIQKSAAQYVTVMIHEKTEILKLMLECRTLGIKCIFLYVDNVIDWDSNNVDETKAIADIVIETSGTMEDLINSIPPKVKEIEELFEDSTVSRAYNQLPIRDLISPHYQIKKSYSHRLPKFGAVPKYPDEDVLCIQTKDIDAVLQPDVWPNEYVIGSYNLLNTIDSLPHSYINRQICEEDSHWTQVIPYILIKNKDNYFFSYARNGNETRLTGQRGIGVGGHVAKEDGGIIESILREVTEELGYVPMFNALRYCGYVKDNRTEVSSKHLGLIFILTLSGPLNATNISSEISNEIGWIRIKEARDEKYESWARIIASNLVVLADHPAVPEGGFGKDSYSTPIA